MSMSSLETQMLTLTAEYQKKFNLTAAAAAKRASGDLLTTPEKANAYLGHRVAHEPLPSPDERSVRAELARVQTEENCSASEAAAIIIARADAARFSQHVHNLQLSGLDATTALMRAQHDDPQGATAWREAGVN